ncbi:hypothetical protein FBU31_004512 [Coemansia sp. 'formosensis']|nr:hypothetical protein FBU31_004512 [Coemansia sp. 'formosensis']
MAELVPSELKVADLRKELAARALPTAGLKKDLVERLEEALAASGTPVQPSVGKAEEDNDNIEPMPVEEITELGHDESGTAMLDEEPSDKVNAVNNDKSAEMMDDSDAQDPEHKRKADEQASHDSHMETDDVASALPQLTSGDSLYIKNLERPLTVYRLKEMLEKYGVVADVWLNSIKTRGYVSFETTEQAVTAHAAINGIRFPPEHGQILECGFITSKRLKELIVDEEASSEFVRNVDLVAIPVEGDNCGVALVKSMPSRASKKQKTDKPVEIRIKGDSAVGRAATLAAETSVSLITAAAAAAASEAKSAAAHDRRDHVARRASDSQGGESESRRQTRAEIGVNYLLTKTNPKISYRPLSDEEVAAKKAARAANNA